MPGSGSCTLAGPQGTGWWWGYLGNGCGVVMGNGGGGGTGNGGGLVQGRTKEELGKNRGIKDPAA